ncbi:hypothetical protein NQZ68_011076 [Dissostichus eleginoides]|nr:hypothetical protein NQZ68_011076 [Dissostichus eleginoides]
MEVQDASLLQGHGRKTNEYFSALSSLLSYSGLNSYDVLDSYRDQVFDVPGAVEKLGAALAGFKAVPNAVGLGALIISMILESVGKSLGKQTMGTAEMLQRVFAEEKGNEVRDLMDEYLKRLRINLGKPQLQLAETRQIEIDLSAQLTRLKILKESGNMKIECGALPLHHLSTLAAHTCF